MPTIKPTIVPHLWFDKHAKEAAAFYCSIFPDSEIHSNSTLHDIPTGYCDVVTFSLAGQRFIAISAGPYFKFNEAISFMVICDTQEEIDFYWEKLSAVPGAEQSGWLKDKFGMSWQITANRMNEMMQSSDSEKVGRLTQAMLRMKKIELSALQAAFDG